MARGTKAKSETDAIGTSPKPKQVKDKDPDYVPDYVLFREISFAIDRDGLQFVFYDPKPREKLVNGIGAYIDDLLNEPIFPDRSPFVGLEPPEVRTPLDLRVSESTFVVFRLDRRWNWQFSSTKPAMWNKDENHGRHYGRLRHVLNKAPGELGSKPVGDGCKIAYFIANPPDKGTGPKPEKPYVHGFDFYVEFLQKPHVRSTETRKLPIVIDPDIRNPDGSPDRVFRGRRSGRKAEV